jgi:ApbE superfamily uncharacterized protein (UPF0280 family)
MLFNILKHNKGTLTYMEREESQGMRVFKTFEWKQARYRICSSHYSVVVESIKKSRALLEEYIEYYTDFKTSLVPLTLKQTAPPIARSMAEAAKKTGVGPMAAVAGAIAETAAKTAILAGADEAIVENGGDIYLISRHSVSVGIYPGNGKLAHTLAFFITPEQMPLAICSSSSKMGHSLSFGICDLATIVSQDGALADAAATSACNAVRTEDDIKSACEKIVSIPGILGVLIIKDERVGIAGDLPQLIKNVDPELKYTITHDTAS